MAFIIDSVDFVGARVDSVIEVVDFEVTPVNLMTECGSASRMNGHFG